VSVVRTSTGKFVSAAVTCAPAIVIVFSYVTAGHTSATSHVLTAARHVPPALPATCVHALAVHASTVHPLPSSQLTTFAHVVPQLVLVLSAVSQPSARLELQSSVLAAQLTHAPLLHVWLAPHTAWLQPQSLRVLVFSHTPGVASQSCVPAAHAAQAPDEHVCTTLQATVFVQFVPQLAFVLSVLSHTPGVASQSSVPAAQLVHEPDEQVWFAAHVEVVHVVPQLAFVLSVFSQPSAALVLQSNVPAAHAPHTPVVRLQV
jgi:hypothetical protein